MAARIGTLLDRLWKKKLEKEDLEERLRKCKLAYKGIENLIFDRFRKEDIDQSSGGVAKASMTSVVHPTIKDHGDLARFIYRNKAIDLLQNRIAKGNWLDRLEERRNKPIPGVIIHEQRKLNLRKK